VAHCDLLASYVIDLILFALAPAVTMQANVD